MVMTIHDWKNFIILQLFYFFVSENQESLLPPE